MQVSWIDEDELRALAARLQDEPPAAAPAVTWDAAGLQSLAESLLASMSAPEPTPPASPAPAVTTAPSVPISLPSPPPPVAEEAEGSAVPPAFAPAIPLTAASAPPVASVVEAPAPASAPEPPATELQSGQPTPLAPPEAALASSDPTPEPPPLETVEDDSSHPEVLAIKERLQAIRERAQASGLLPLAAPAAPPRNLTPSFPFGNPLSIAAPAKLALEEFPSLPSLEVTAPQAEAAPPSTLAPPSPETTDGTTLADRLDQFANWISTKIPAEQTLVLDGFGSLLWGNPAPDDLVLAAMLATSSPAEPVGPTRLRRSSLGPGRNIVALPCVTKHGAVTLVLIAPSPADALTLSEAGHQLVAAVEGPL